jgi:hypothetical protein
VPIPMPSSFLQVIHRCAEGSEGLELLAESVERTWDTCGHHNPIPEQVSCWLISLTLDVVVPDGLLHVT